MTDQPSFPSTCYQSSQLPTCLRGPGAQQKTARQQPILDIVQEPGRTRVTRVGRPKMRFNLQPPPILRLRYISMDHDAIANCVLQHANEDFKLNPRLFVMATLLRSHESTRTAEVIEDGRLLGSTVTSPHMLRNGIEAVSCNMDLEDGPLFVFSDLACTTEGRYKLEFNLYELGSDRLNFLLSTTSKPFAVTALKDCPGRPSVTQLSLACHNQGVRLKIRRAMRRKKSSESDNDLEGGRESTDHQRQKYRRLMPNDYSVQLEKHTSEPSLCTAEHTSREDMLHNWSQSSHERSFHSSPNWRHYLQGPSPHLPGPPEYTEDCGAAGRKIEHHTDGSHSYQRTRPVAASNRGLGTTSSTSAPLSTDQRYQSIQVPPCPDGLGLSTPGPWLEERQRVLRPTSSARAPLWDTRGGSDRTSAQLHLTQPSLSTFHHQGPVKPNATYALDWDCIYMSIPSPTTVSLPPHMGPGFAGSVTEE